MNDCTYRDISQGAISTIAGEDVVVQFEVRDPCGDPVDIAGWTFSFFAKDTASATTFSVTNGSFTITAATAGQAQFPVASATTAAQGGVTFDGQLWRTNSGFNSCLIKGQWVVNATLRS